MPECFGRLSPLDEAVVKGLAFSLACSSGRTRSTMAHASDTARGLQGERRDAPGLPQPPETDSSTMPDRR
jgi:hypothetical protein